MQKLPKLVYRTRAIKRLSKPVQGRAEKKGAQFPIPVQCVQKGTFDRIWSLLKRRVMPGATGVGGVAWGGGGGGRFVGGRWVFLCGRWKQVG